MNRIFAGVIAIMLAGCQGQPAPDAAPVGARAVNQDRAASGICRVPLGGGGATIQLRHGPLSGFEYNSLRAEYLEQAIDTDESTYAIIESLISVREDVTLTATAQPGTVFPGGAPAAVVVELHGGGYFFTGQVQTLLNGLVQDTAYFHSSGEDGIQTLSIETHGPFDAVELNFTDLNGAGADVYEFCAESKLQ